MHTKKKTKTAPSKSRHTKETRLKGKPVDSKMDRSKNKVTSTAASAKKAKVKTKASPPKAKKQNTAPQKPRNPKGKPLLKFKINPEFEKLLATLTKEEYNLLKKSICEHGQMDPIRVGKDGTIYDGHNRHKICGELGIVPKYEIIDIGDDNTIKLWIFEQQLGRRNLTKFQRTEYALNCKNLIAAKAKENQRAGGGAVRLKSEKPVNTNKVLAKFAKVSPDTVSKVEHIVKHADEETKENLRRGDKSTSINKAYTNLKTEQAKKEPAKSKVTTSASTGKNEKPTKQQDFVQSGKSHGISTELQASEIPSPDTLAAAMTEKDSEDQARYVMRFLECLAANKEINLACMCLNLFQSCFNLMDKWQQAILIFKMCYFLKEQKVADNTKILSEIHKEEDEQAHPQDPLAKSFPASPFEAIVSDKPVIMVAGQPVDLKSEVWELIDVIVANKDKNLPTLCNGLFEYSCNRLMTREGCKWLANQVSIFSSKQGFGNGDPLQTEQPSSGEDVETNRHNEEPLYPLCPSSWPEFGGTTEQ